MKNWKQGTMELDVKIPHKQAVVTFSKHAKSGGNVMMLDQGDYSNLEILGLLEVAKDTALAKVKREGAQRSARYIMEEANKEEVEVNQVGEIKWQHEGDQSEKK